MKIIAVIPSHLASIRLKQKILLQIHGLEMIEHVRRRAILSNAFDKVIVATGDQPILDLVKSYGGEVIKTNEKHLSGTSRVAEAVKNLDASHIVVLQGDEPLMIPEHLSKIVANIKKNPEFHSWNATSAINNKDELDKHSFVKCSVNQNQKIMYCFRRSPSFAPFSEQKKYVRKILGLIAYKKEVLEELNKKPASLLETYESIEQMKIITYGYDLHSVSVEPSLPSINEPGDEAIVLDLLKKDKYQQKLLNNVLAFK